MGAALLGTLAGFGINEGQIWNLQNRLSDLNNDHIHLSSKVDILEDTIEYNSIELKKLKLSTSQSLNLIKKSLTDIDINFVKVSNDIKELKLQLIQLAASVSFEKLLNNNNKVLRELAGLFSGRLSNDILTDEVKLEICQKVDRGGFKLFGGCNGLNYLFPLFKITHIYTKERLIFFISLPVTPMQNIDKFTLYNLRSLPININKTSIKLKVDTGDSFLAVGKKYYIKLKMDDCVSTANFIFCNPMSHYNDFGSGKDCISEIINNNTNILKVCNFEKVKNENTFLKVRGSYYYSVFKRLNLEIFCPTSTDNSNISISGIGKIILKPMCFAKHLNILLTGTHNFNLNKSINIKFESFDNYSLFKNKNLESIKMHSLKGWGELADIELENIDTDTPHIAHFINSQKRSSNHFIILYILSALSILCIIIICFCILIRTFKAKNVVNNAPSNTTKEDMNSKNKETNTLVNPNENDTSQNTSKNYYINK